ncbi:DUF4232 domain-containing protein [Streptomyces sp. NBC_01497]|uniref:DUF4232 domain-containing protein n=1 Tax=Streptomyces sp. NBC_01497 TaxID=2903885 RepID=UPI002E32EF4A|nr:DUF4232 domain-containing protein [Streptomyces sp. NBC_01497]
MRLKKISALTLVAATAGLCLTACGSSEGSSTSAAPGTSTSASGGTGRQDSSAGSSAAGPTGSTGSSSTGSSSAGSSSTDSSSRGSSKGSDLSVQTQSSASASRCDADHLALSASSAMAENEIVVNMKNTGSSTCGMRGFPGVQLVGPDGLGDTGPDAARTDATGAGVTIAPGEETRFLLHWIPDTSGSGKTYTRLDVTPPDERISEIVNLNKLTITVPATSSTSPDVFVDPIGYHTGTGK